MNAARAALRVVVLSLVTVAAGCGRPAENVEQASSPPAVTATAPEAPAQPAPATDAFDAWLGQWNGPEGTFIVLSKANDGFEITIQSLDGPATYVGRAAGDRIQFERNGRTESIRATGGRETGMKWLLDKTNCLTIQAGEGFCRD